MWHEDVEQYSEYELEEQAKLRDALKVLATYLGITDFATRFPYPT